MFSHFQHTHTHTVCVCWKCENIRKVCVGVCVCLCVCVCVWVETSENTESEILLTSCCSAGGCLGPVCTLCLSVENWVGSVLLSCWQDYMVCGCACVRARSRVWESERERESGRWKGVRKSKKCLFKCCEQWFSHEEGEHTALFLFFCSGSFHRGTVFSLFCELKANKEWEKNGISIFYTCLNLNINTVPYCNMNSTIRQSWWGMFKMWTLNNQQNTLSRVVRKWVCT